MRRRSLGVAIAFSVALLAPPLGADESPDARARLTSAIRRVQEAPSLRVRMRASYDVVQESGVELEFGTVRKVAVRRPDRMRVDVDSREQGAAEIYFDGTALTVYTAAANAYARTQVGSTLDDALDAMERDLGMPMQLDALLRSDTQQRIDAVAIDAFVVGVTTLDGIACDHVVLQTGETDVQLWLTQGADALIRRVVITYLGEPGRPQFRADLLDWELGPELPDSLFRFDPPDGAEKVAFVRAGAADERARKTP